MILGVLNKKSQGTREETRTLLSNDSYPFLKKELLKKTWYQDNITFIIKYFPHLKNSISISHNLNRYSVVSWSRIDNLKDLSSKLKIPFTELAKYSSADIILQAYSKWGKACVHHLIGDWAFALWDSKTATLFLA